MVDGAEPPDYTAGVYTVTVTISMPDGTDRAATTEITDDSTERYIGQVTSTALRLLQQRHARQRRMAEVEAQP